MRIVASLIIVAAGVVGPRAADAQGMPYGTVAIATGQEYDSNVFSTTETAGVRSDMWSRVGPIVDGGYAWSRVKLGGRYRFDADRYRRFGELNRLFAREDGGVELRLVATPRFRVSADATYLATDTPGELNLDTLLITGRRPATRLALMSDAVYDLSPVLSVVVAQSLTRDTIVGGVGNDSQAVRVGFDRRMAGRDTVGVSYELRHVAFSERSTELGREMFHVVRARWAHAITPQTRFELEGGPHIADDAIRPEMSAVLRRDSPRTEWSVSYAREQTTTIGEAGIIDVHRIAGGGTFRPVPRVSLTALPAFAYNRRDRPRGPRERFLPVYTVDSEAAFQAAARVAIVVSGRYGRQRGGAIGVGAIGVNDPIVSRRVAAHVVVTVVKSRGMPGEWPRAVGRNE